MSAALMKKLLKQRTREIHNENVAIAANNPTIKPGLVFHKGFRAHYPAPCDVGRKVRRKLERQAMKRLGAKQ